VARRSGGVRDGHDSEHLRRSAPNQSGDKSRALHTQAPCKILAEVDAVRFCPDPEAGSVPKRGGAVGFEFHLRGATVNGDLSGHGGKSERHFVHDVGGIGEQHHA
jgi:hypothetical protein